MTIDELENTSKSFSAKKELIDWKNKFEKSNFFVMLGITLIMILFSLNLYHNLGDKPVLFVFVLIYLLALGFGLVTYTNRKQSKVINNIIHKVKINNDEISFETFGVKTAPMINYSSKRLTLKLDEFLFKKKNFILKDKKFFPEKAQELSYESEKYYLLEEFFEDDLSNLLSLN